MTQEADTSGDVESRLRDLQVLADEGLITPEEHQEHRRRLQGEVRRSAEDRGRSQAETAPTEAMHGNAVALLDDLIGMWSRWDANERYYLEELVPRIVRSDDPEFAWMNTGEERVVATRLRALMSPEEWRILPELIRARRSLGLHELDSDKGRPERLTEQGRPRREAERERDVAEEWAEASGRARREGEERIRNEQEAERARLEREAEEQSGAGQEHQPARGRRRRPRRKGRRSAAEPDPTADRGRDSSDPSLDTTAEAGPTEPVSVQPAELESAPVPADEGSERDMSDEPAPADAEVTGPPETNAPDGEQVATNTESEPAAADSPALAGQNDSLVPDGVALELRGFAGRLRGAGERSLADAVSDYADRVRAVRRGELSPALSAAPAAVTPEMVGAAIARSRIELLVEVVRNVLIFMPVLWTWLKLQAAVSAYDPESLDHRTFFDFWVQQGGESGLLGGTLADAARDVAVLLTVLITVNVLLGLLRGRTASRKASVERHFAATLARAEAAGAAQRIADPQVALEGFVHASHDLTSNLRSVSELLEASVSPFAEAQEAAALSAQALAGIRDSLAPSARDFAGAAATLEQLAEQLERMTENMAGAVANLESGLDSSAADLREAASSMRTVSTRVLDELGDGRGRRR